MAYTFFEDFKIRDTEMQPYSMELERGSVYTHHHGVLTEDGYRLTCPGGKHVLKTPALSTFALSAEVIYQSPLYLTNEWSILFGYHKKTRSGYGVSFVYDPPSHTLEIVYSQYGAAGETPLCSQSRSVEIGPDREYTVTLTCTETECSGTFADVGFRFPKENAAGAVAITSSRFSGNCIVLRSISVNSGDPIGKTVIRPYSEIEIPVRNGVFFPYRIGTEIVKYENCDYDELTVTLSAGIKDRKLSDSGKDCWAFADEMLTAPFIRITDPNTTEKLFLWNGQRIITDPQAHEGVIRSYQALDVLQETPVRRTFMVSRQTEHTQYSFGYENLTVAGNALYEGEHEFLFSDDGRVVWDGPTLDHDFLCEVSSGENKKIVEKIPKTIRMYGPALQHAIGNHYFFEDEEITLRVELLSGIPEEYLDVRFYFETVFGDPLGELHFEKCGSGLQTLPRGFYGYAFRGTVAPQKIGVYRLKTVIYYNGQPAETHVSVLEVFDENSDESPQHASGLPHFHCGDGGPIDNYVSIPDPWYPQRDMNIPHYIDCAIYLPPVGEERKVWELLGLYRREWFLWLTRRTIGRRSYTEYSEALRHADYANIAFPLIEEAPDNYYRFDLWSISVYTAKMREILWDFLNENPEYGERCGFENVRERFEKRDLYKLFDVCCSEWLSYANARIREVLQAQWRDVLKTNPGLKRSSYGPYPVYVAALQSANSGKFFGAPADGLNELFDGFMQFEDYPFYCSYHVHRGAWTAATLKLTCPDMRLRPELYGSSFYCPDGFVAFAHPPFGRSFFPEYTVSSQIFEYKAASAYYRDNRFGFWDDDEFMYFVYAPDNARKRFDCILNTWRQLRDHTPDRPVRAAAFVADYSEREDRFDHEMNGDDFYNISESAISYLHGIHRENGRTAGFATTFDGLLTLDSGQIEILVLPSLKKASAEVIKRIRLLHGQGVPLFAVSDIDGLEDLFGVKPCRQSAEVYSVSDGAETENVFPAECEFRYAAVTAETVLSADGRYPVILRNNGTALLNTSVQRLGVDNCGELPFKGNSNISALLQKCCLRLFGALTDPVAYTDKKAGCALYRDKGGSLCLMVTDFTDWGDNGIDWEHTRRVNVHLNGLGITQAIPLEERDSASLPVKKISDTETAFTVEIRPLETKLFLLK